MRSDGIRGVSIFTVEFLRLTLRTAKAVTACRSRQSKNGMGLAGKVAGRHLGGNIMSTKSAAVRKTRINAERLVEYLGINEVATVSAIVHDRLMNSRDTAEALQYAIRHGVIAREKCLGAAPDERVRYRLTGQPLVAIREVSFSSMRCSPHGE
jgi:TPP-dependent indolepyruvate ferredoxin oxidoreductase alpha subunit